MTELVWDPTISSYSHLQLMLGFKFDASLLVFSFFHAGVCSFFYYMTNVHSITVSICRVSCAAKSK